VPVAVTGAERGACCRVVHPELVDRTGDATPSLDAVESRETSDVTSSPPLEFVRKAGFSELSMKTQGEPPKLKAEFSLEGEDALDACSASYQEKQNQRNPKLNGSQDLLVSLLDPETLNAKSDRETRRYRFETNLSAAAP
jgi:hypothetical protein